MHISAIRKFLSDHQVVVAENLTTSQINRAVVKPETEGTNKPYIEKYSGITDGSGTALVAPATVFVSHAWKYSFADTVADSMEHSTQLMNQMRISGLICLLMIRMLSPRKILTGSVIHSKDQSEK